MTKSQKEALEALMSEYGMNRAEAEEELRATQSDDEAYIRSFVEKY